MGCCRIPRGGQDHSLTLQHVNHRIPDIHATEDGDALLTKGTCQREIPLAVGGECEVVQGEPLTKWLAQFPENGEAFLTEASRIGGVSKIPRDIAEDHQRNSRAASIPCRSVEDQRFLGEGGCSLEIPELARCPAEKAE